MQEIRLEPFIKIWMEERGRNNQNNKLDARDYGANNRLIRCKIL
jgi:hypothetical protein